jgi:hypothetical protein
MNPIHVLLSALLLSVTLISYLPLILFSVMQQPNSGPCCLVFEVSRSHTIRHTHKHTHAQSVGVLWTSDQLVAEAGIYTTHNSNKRQISKPSAGFITANPAIERQQTVRPPASAILPHRKSECFLPPGRIFAFVYWSLPFKGWSGLNFSKWITTISWIYSLRFTRNLIFNCYVLDK